MGQLGRVKRYKEKKRSIKSNQQILVAKDHHKILMCLEASLMRHTLKMQVFYNHPFHGAGPLSSNSLTLSRYSGMYNIKHDRYWGQIINKSWKHVTWKDVLILKLNPRQNWDFRSVLKVELEQSWLLGILQRIRCKSEPAEVAACIHTFIGTDRHPSGLRWKPYEMPWQCTALARSPASSVYSIGT